MTRLDEILVEAGLEPLSSELNDRFRTYLQLLLKWNAKLNLTSIRSEGDILRRHFVECIFCAVHLPEGLGTLLDFGSGAGFPGIPIALCRPEIAVTLAESQGKKCGFLREAVRQLGIGDLGCAGPEIVASGVRVHCGRAEDLVATFDAVAMRAVDHMRTAVDAAVERLKPGGVLALLGTDSGDYSGVRGIAWEPPVRLPLSVQGVMRLGRGLT